MHTNGIQRKSAILLTVNRLSLLQMGLPSKGHMVSVLVLPSRSQMSEEKQRTMEVEGEENPCRTWTPPMTNRKERMVSFLACLMFYVVVGSVSVEFSVSFSTPLSKMRGSTEWSPCGVWTLRSPWPCVTVSGQLTRCSHHTTMPHWVIGAYSSGRVG